MASSRYCCRRLPMDTIHEILVRLRVKTLCKFLCVSKSWYALISDPVFRSSHDRRAKENPLIIVANSIPCHPSPRGDIHISMLDSNGNLVEKSTIKTSRNSTISVFTCPDLVVVDECNNLYLCNTISRDVIKMPTRRKYSKVNRYVLAHVPSTKEYKLFAIGLNYYQGFEYEVITIGDDCWRTVSNPPIPAVSTYFGVHVDEAIYMMPEFDSDPYVKGMVRFDLEREKWSVVPTLSGPSFHGGLTSRILRGTGEQLWVAEWREESLFGERDIDLDLWSLKDRDKGVWMKECRVRIPFPDLPHPCQSFSPLAIDNDGRVLINMRKVGSTGNCKLLLCNSDGRKDFQVILEGEYGNCRICFYVESFEYLKCLPFAKAALSTEGERTC